MDRLVTTQDLDGHAQQYTFFASYEQNVHFLNALNFWSPDADADHEKSGFVVSLRRYSKVKQDERRGVVKPFQKEARESSLSRHLLCWRTEYLCMSMYLRMDITQKQLAPLFGISDSTLSDLVYAWANVLKEYLSLLFPNPTRSQILRAYPIHFIKKFGDAQTMMILDATEFWTQIASHTGVHAILYSSYKGHDTMKVLAACDIIGCTYDGSIPDKVYGGSIGDVMATNDSKILLSVPFGSKVEVDKGFLLDNLCACLGIGLVRPVKRQRNQTQTSAEDTAETQKNWQHKNYCGAVEWWSQATRAVFQWDHTLDPARPCPSSHENLLSHAKFQTGVHSWA
jgi:hypothetical protein